MATLPTFSSPRPEGAVGVTRVAAAVVGAGLVADQRQLEEIGCRQRVRENASACLRVSNGDGTQRQVESLVGAGAGAGAGVGDGAGVEGSCGSWD